MLVIKIYYGILWNYLVLIRWLVINIRRRRVGIFSIFGFCNFFLLIDSFLFGYLNILEVLFGFIEMILMKWNISSNL